MTEKKTLSAVAFAHCGLLEFSSLVPELIFHRRQETGRHRCLTFLFLSLVQLRFEFLTLSCPLSVIIQMTKALTHTEC